MIQLLEIRAAEVVVERVLGQLIASPPIVADDAWIEPAIAEAVEDIAGAIPDLDRKLLADERSRLLRGVLEQRFCVATGRPGSGKTRGLEPFVKALLRDGQQVTVLAPTGKAALQAARAMGVEAQTIDRWLWHRGYGQAIRPPACSKA